MPSIWLGGKRDRLTADAGAGLGARSARDCVIASVEM